MGADQCYIGILKIRSMNADCFKMSVLKVFLGFRLLRPKIQIFSVKKILTAPLLVFNYNIFLLKFIAYSSIIFKVLLKY